MSYDDALEGALTNGLGRCVGKSLGSYSECWDPRWAEYARSQVCSRVEVLERDNRVAYRWRRTDRAPLDGERPPRKTPKPPSETVDPPLSTTAPPPVATTGSDGETIGQIRRTQTTSGHVYYVVVTDKTPERL